jgi:hypothetical protein
MDAEFSVKHAIDFLDTIGRDDDPIRTNVDQSIAATRRYLFETVGVGLVR